MLRRRAKSFPRADVNRVGEIAVQTMLSVPAWSPMSDVNGLSYLIHFGAWVHANEGCFDPETHMDDDRIETWIDSAYPHRRPTTRNAARDSLRRIRDQRPARNRIQRGNRPTTKTPHTVLEWAHFEAVAYSLQNSYIGRSLRLLLDLTGECGLRPDEVIRADGHWITVVGSEVNVAVTNVRSVVREVPVSGPVAARLRPLAGTSDFLVLPNAPKKRHNAITAVILQANRYGGDGMQGFSAQRARHMWLTKLMSEPIPFLTLASVADINPGSHMPCDLLPYTPAIDPRTAAAALRRLKAGQ